MRGLRSLYAAPAGDAYWNELESRIMARVADVELGWWTELDRWIRPARRRGGRAAARRRCRDVPRPPGRSATSPSTTCCRRQPYLCRRPSGRRWTDDRDARIRYLFGCSTQEPSCSAQSRQALMFLLGAVLVGGALGFSADRYIGHEKIVVAVRPAPEVLRRVGSVAAAARHARLARVPAGLSS